MKLLYCSWNENSVADTICAMKELGIEVYKINGYISDYNIGKMTMDIAREVKNGIDIVFSYDFIPIVSEICNKRNIPYISWVYDWPNFTLYNPAVYNRCNRIYLFDRMGMSELKKYGIDNVRYHELAVNTKRLDDMLGQDIDKNGYEYDVSFVGSMYPDVAQIFPDENIPDYYRGYIEALVNAQSRMYGYNLIDEVINREFAKKYYKDSRQQYDGRSIPYEVLLSSQINKVLTGIERRKFLKKAAEKYRVSVFTGTENIDLKDADIHKPVDYFNEMPQIFRKTKINLNITLRSISSGVPLRAFDILGAGGFCLTNYQEEIREHFTDGKDLVMYESLDDMISKIDYYLKNDDERLKIAKNGHETVRKYNYNNALSEIIGL